MKELSKDKILKILFYLSILSTIVSSYLVKGHYSEGSICDFTAKISCSVINTSVYSEFMHVPVAIFGVLWSIILLLMIKKLRKNKHDENKSLFAGLFLWSIAGIISVIYFIYAEIVLKALCPFCTVIHIIAIITFILAFKLYKREHIKFHKSMIKDLKGYIKWVIGTSIFLLIIFNIGATSDTDYSKLADCLSEKNVVMYGGDKCGHCIKNKEMFGDDFKKITYIECNPFAINSQYELCEKNMVTGTPTWIQEDENGTEIKRNAGFMDGLKLSVFFNCE